MSKERARRIKLLLFDVDGVLTDGKIWIFPAPANAQAFTQEHRERQADQGGFAFAGQGYVEAKGFNAHDGTAVSLARLGGMKLGLITKRISETVALRARDLKLEHVYQGIQDKLSVFEEILAKEHLPREEAAYVGDDIIDLPVLRNCGFAIAVANSREEVKDEAHYITDHGGGDGALRDAVEYILKAQGKWEQVLEAYISQRNPTKSGN
jgi:3-deoxy-D-manno-octulosonate 8-phosphate phosphatase (KDO 8-P phosphatase)